MGTWLNSWLDHDSIFPDMAVEKQTVMQMRIEDMISNGIGFRPLSSIQRFDAQFRDFNGEDDYLTILAHLLYMDSITLFVEGESVGLLVYRKKRFEELAFLTRKSIYGDHIADENKLREAEENLYISPAGVDGRIPLRMSMLDALEDYTEECALSAAVHREGVYYF